MIVYRTDGPWGTGLGANLPAATIDGNFYDLDGRVTDLESNPPTARSILSIVTDSNIMTITYTDSSTDVLVLPVASIRFTGPYQGGTTYLINDIFTVNGQVYIVRHGLTAPDDFNPNETTVDGTAYSLILDRPLEVYDFAYFMSGPFAYESGPIVTHVAARDFVIKSDFSECQAFLRIAVTDTDLSLPITINGTVVGFLDFVMGANLESGGPGQFGTFSGVTSPGEPLAIVRGDLLRFEAPQVIDSTAEDLSLTIGGQITVLTTAA